MPSTNDFTPNNVWSSATPSGVEEEVTTPSGQTCRARKMSIESMITSGVLTQSDALTAMVSKHIKKSRGTKNKVIRGEDVDLQSLMGDSQSIKSMIDLCDRVLPSIIISPVVKLHFVEQTVGKTTVTKVIPSADREAGVVYTDQIDFGDKMYLFDWAAGGLGSMIQFRQ